MTGARHLLKCHFSIFHRLEKELTVDDVVNLIQKTQEDEGDVFHIRESDEENEDTSDEIDDFHFVDTSDEDDGADIYFPGGL